jgi:predicted aldo/keto reductase-like oxidoreductase
MPCPENVDITGLFKLEGIFDRQMIDGNIENPAEFALKERLKHWFGTQGRAIYEYSKLKINASVCSECGFCMDKCPYKIDIIRKLKNIDYKLNPSYGRIWE